MIKSTQPLIVTLFVILATSCNNTETLFQENANDWFEEGDATWSFNNHELEATIDEGTGFVMTNKPFKDFVLKLEFYPDSTINSGVFLRCKAYNIDATDCHEINIWDLHPNQDFRTGAIVTKSIPITKVNTLNKWNTYKIKNQNNRIEVWVNDTLTADIQDNSLEEGFIGLQAAGTGKIKFRNTTLEQLK